MGRISTAFGRLSRREKILVGTMGGLVFFLIIFLLNVAIGSRVSTLETNVAKEQDILREVCANADAFVAAQRTLEARRQRAEKNAKLNVTEAIAALAQQVSLESVDIRNQPTGRKRLDDFLDYAPPKDTALGRKKTARAKDKDAKADTLANYWRRDVEVSVRDNATFEAIYELMEKVEESQDLLFVTELRLERNRRNPDRAGRGKIVVSTYYYEEKKEE